MSVVVAVKDTDRVWVACDSQSTGGYTKRTLTNKNNYKISKPEKEKETIIGVVGDAKLTNIIKIEDFFVDELTKLKDSLDFKYVVKTIVPNIFSLCKNNQLVTKVKDQESYTMNGGVTFAHKNKLFTIESNGYVTEIDDYCADGSGYRLALGYLNQHSDEGKKDMAIKAVKSACESDLFVNYPIIVMNTFDDEILIIEK